MAAGGANRSCTLLPVQNARFWNSFWQAAMFHCDVRSRVQRWLKNTEKKMFKAVYDYSNRLHIWNVCKIYYYLLLYVVQSWFHFVSRCFFFFFSCAAMFCRCRRFSFHFCAVFLSPTLNRNACSGNHTERNSHDSFFFHCLIFFFLFSFVTVSRAKILGNSEIFVKSGSDINLSKCTWNGKWKTRRTLAP